MQAFKFCIRYLHGELSAGRINLRHLAGVARCRKASISRMPGVPTGKQYAGRPCQQTRLRAACAGRSRIVIIECGNVPTAALALKADVRGVVQKPCRDRDLPGRIVNALEANAYSRCVYTPYVGYVVDRIDILTSFYYTRVVMRSAS